MKHLNFLLAIAFLAIAFSSAAQNYNMSNTTITDCGGTFYDSGGTGNYSNGENITFTICPSTPGAFATVNFTTFDIENNYDLLTIYDGDNTGANTLGTYTGTTGPGFVSATSSNPTGCLTFVFTSDGSVTDIGWVGTIGCTQPCQDVIADANFSPAPDGDGIIRLCQGETLTMNGVGIYPDNNTGYSQSDGTSTFEWSTQDGANPTGQTVSHTFNNSGAYFIQLEITDIEGCSNSNDIDQVVFVSTTPVFSGTIGTPDPICLGEQANFTGVATPVLYEQQCTQPTFPPISLPDGSGVSYQTSVNIDCYGSGQQLTDISDLLSICLNMEHSYTGDLNIAIECPSGQTVTLLDYSTNNLGGVYLGNPVDDDTQPNVQGTGADYCWDPLATNGTWNDNDPGTGTLPSGTYESDQNLSGLQGCDMNGDWTLIITDNLSSDNGFIFDWSLNFDPSILPPATTFTPSIVSDGWQADPTIVSGTNPITVEPTSTGSACYTYQVTDYFGCNYDTTVCITVNPSPVIDPIANITDCNPVTLPNITGIDLSGNQAFFTGSGGTGTQYNPGDVISASTTLYIYDEASIAPFCSDEEVFDIIITNPVLSISCPGPLTAVCDIAEVPAYTSFTDFQNAGGSASTTAGANVLPSSFTMLSEVSDNNSCPETVVRTYQIQDDCGNIETCTQIITIHDLQAPVFDPAPADVTVECIGDVPAMTNLGWTDNCDGTGTVAGTDGAIVGGNCGGTITRTWTYTDACGNPATTTQTITIDDNIAPTASNPATTTVECTTDVPAVDPAVVIDEADNCTANPTVTFISETSDNNVCNGEQLIRTYEIADDCGNTTTVTHTIIIDSYTPTFTVAGTDPTVCGGTDGFITISGLNPNTNYGFEFNGNAVTTITTNGAGEHVITGLGAGTYTSFTLSDADCPACSTTDGLTITLTDPNPPTVDAGLDQQVCEGSTVTLTAFNPDGSVITWNNGVVDGNPFNQVVGTITYTVTADLAGCINTDQVNVTVVPTIDDLTCPGQLTAVCDISEQPAYTDFAAFIADGGSATIDPAGVIDSTSFALISEVSDNNSCPETITRTYQIADTCGVLATCTQDIIIHDLVAPTASNPAPLVVQCIADVPAPDITVVTNAADNCTANPTVTHVSDVSDNNTCAEIITRTYAIADDCGNTTTVTQSITIDDNIAPTATAPGPVTVQCVADIPAINIADVTGVSDNCTANPAVTHVSDVSDNNTCAEIITRTYDITDDCGNTTTVTQTITIDDNIAPTASNPATTTVECTTDVPAVDPAVVIDEADNCTANPTVTFISETSDNNVCNGEQLIRTYEIADDCGNTTTVTHTIIIDSYTPTFTVAGTDPTVCGGTDGFITISGLNPNTNYGFEFNGNAVTTITTNGAGEHVITGLGAGTYTSFTLSDADCPACSTTDGLTITLTDPNPPTVDAGLDQQVCEGSTVTLVAANPDNAVISWDNGITDNSPFTPAVGTTTFTVTANLAGCISTDQVNVTVIPQPLIDGLANQEECDSYALPVITGTNLTGNEAYYDAPNGGGIQYNAGDLITTAGTTTFYIYDETATTPNCFDEQMFDVTINLTPVLDGLANQEECDSYTLPTITGTNLTGNEAYYDAPNGGGTQYNAGDLITAAGTTTLYIYDQTATTPNCFDEQTFDVTINLTPVIDGLTNQEECDSYTLPVITGTNLTGNEAYYDAPNGGGTQYNAGDVITTAGTTTLYIYDETVTTPNCFDEQTFDVTINLTPVIDGLANQEECDSYTLPVITGTNLTGNEAYYDAPNGGGTQYNAGDFITTAGTTTLYMYDETATTPNCFNEQVFDVTINITPTFTLASTDPTACGAADGTIIISGLEPNTTYDVTYTDAGGVPLGTNTMNSDAVGDIVIGGLTAGSYSDFIVALNGCVTTDNSTINLVDPNAPALDAGADQEVCEGEEITLTASNPDGANISWNNGVTDGVPFNQAVGTITYTATAELLGCISTDQVNVTVNPLPNVFAGNDVEICEGDQVVLTGSGADSYAWDNGVVNGQPFTPSQTNTYTVTGSALGCENTDQLTVTLVENPTVLFEADTTQGCVPLTVNFSNLTQGNIANCTYTFSDGTVLSGCDVSYTFTQVGCHNVTLEVENQTGCISSTTIEDYICVENYPMANFAFEPGEITNLENELSFENTSIGGSSFEWSFGDGGTSNNSNPTYVYDAESGEEEYEVTLVATSEYGCSDTVSTVIPVIEELIFYVPNTFTPDDDIHNPTFKPVFTSGFDPQDYTLLIFNRWGEVIFESRNADIGWDGTYSKESNQIVRDGTYIWKIEFKTKYTDERKVKVGHVNILR